MSNLKYVLDIECFLMLIEPIAKKYIKIKDIEYCFFTKNLRYPVLSKDKFNIKDLENEPTLSMYSAPMMKDIIKVLFARNSRYSKYFIINPKNNSYNDFHNIFKKYFRNEQALELKDDILDYLIKETYNFITNKIVVLMSFTKPEEILQVISNELNVFIEDLLLKITDIEFIEKNSIIRRFEDSVFLQEKSQEFINYHNDYFKNLIEIYLLKDIKHNINYKLNDNGIIDIETIICNFLPGIKEEEVEYIYNIICKLDDQIKTLFPDSLFDHIIEVDDEYSSHIIIQKSHILEVRMQELEENLLRS